METSHITFPLLGTSDNFHAVAGLSLQHGPDVLSTEPGITVDCILKVLLTGLEHRPRSTAPIPPELLIGICYALQGDGVADDFVPYKMPQVLSKLRPWRLLDEKIRCTSQGLHALALELANIRHDGPRHDTTLNGVSELSISQNANGMHVEQTEEENLNSLGQAAFIRNEDTTQPRLADTSPSHVVSSPSHKGKLKLSVSPCPISPRTHRRNNSSAYRSGCIACRRLRGSPPQLSPVLPRTEQSPISTTPVQNSPPSACPYPDPKKPSKTRSTAIDENTPPLPPERANIHSGVQRPRERSKGSMTPPRPSVTSRVLSPSTVAWSKRQLLPGHPRPHEVGSHKNEGINRGARGHALNGYRSKMQNVPQTHIRPADFFIISEFASCGRRSLGPATDPPDRTNRVSSRCGASTSAEKWCPRHFLQPVRRINTVNPCSHTGVANH